MSPAWRLRLFYFLYYGGVGAFLPYFAAYLRGLGFSGEQIGTVQMMGPLVAAPAALTWAAVADRLGAPARALRFATLWALAAAVFLPLARTPLAMGAVLFVQSLAASAMVPLVDSVAIEWVRAQPGRSYTGLRLFGSLGFIALAQGVGLALTARGDLPGDPVVPITVLACVAGYAIAAGRLPSRPRAGERPRLADVAALLRDRELLVLLAACALHWAACAPYHLLFGVFVRDRGLPASVTGLGMAVGVAAEILVFVLLPRLERRLSGRGLFAVAFGGTVLRWLLLSRSESAASIVGLQALHGLTFGLFWGATVATMGKAVPSHLRATGQALVAAVVFGAGNVLGYQLSGAGYDLYRSVSPLFGWAAAVEVVPLLAAVALFRRGTVPSPLGGEGKGGG